MASFIKFQQFVEDKNHGVHNLGSNALKLYLSNVVPDAAADAVKADIAEITAGNGYTGPIALTTSSSGQTAGTYKLVLADPGLITASGGSIGPFRSVILYNDTPTSPADPLIGAWDYGSSITLAAGETFEIDLDQAAGVLTDS